MASLDPLGAQGIVQGTAISQRQLPHAAKHHNGIVLSITSHHNLIEPALKALRKNFHKQAAEE